MNALTELRESVPENVPHAFTSRSHRDGIWIEVMDAQGDVVSVHRHMAFPIRIGSGCDDDLRLFAAGVMPAHLLVSVSPHGVPFIVPLGDCTMSVNGGPSTCVVHGFERWAVVGIGSARLRLVAASSRAIDALGPPSVSTARGATWPTPWRAVRAAAGVLLATIGGLAVIALADWLSRTDGSSFSALLSNQTERGPWLAGWLGLWMLISHRICGVSLWLPHARVVAAGALAYGFAKVAWPLAAAAAGTVVPLAVAAAGWMVIVTAAAVMHVLQLPLARRGALKLALMAMVCGSVPIAKVTYQTVMETRVAVRLAASLPVGIVRHRAEDLEAVMSDLRQAMRCVRPCPIDAAALEAPAAPMLKSGYGQYLVQVLREWVY